MSIIHTPTNVSRWEPVIGLSAAEQSEFDALLELAQPADAGFTSALDRLVDQAEHESAERAAVAAAESEARLAQQELAAAKAEVEAYRAGQAAIQAQEDSLYRQWEIHSDYSLAEGQYISNPEGHVTAHDHSGPVAGLSEAEVERQLAENYPIDQRPLGSNFIEHPAPTETKIVTGDVTEPPVPRHGVLPGDHPAFGFR